MADQWRHRRAEQIKKATWSHAGRSLDVTTLVRDAVREGRRRAVSVEWLGDPDPGWRKVLTIELERGHSRPTYTAKETEPLPRELFEPHTDDTETEQPLASAVE